MTYGDLSLETYQRAVVQAARQEVSFLSGPEAVTLMRLDPRYVWESWRLRRAPREVARTLEDRHMHGFARTHEQMRQSRYGSRLRTSYEYKPGYRLVAMLLRGGVPVGVFHNPRAPRNRKWVYVHFYYGPGAGRGHVAHTASSRRAAARGSRFQARSFPTKG